jgi:hypothetical protein
LSEGLLLAFHESQPGRPQIRLADANVLRCIECFRASLPREGGWRAYGGGGYDLGEIEIGVYCPECAAREFGR